MRDELFNPKKKKKELLFSGPIIFFSYYLVINVLLKILFYEASAGEKITPLIRLFGSFTVYFLLVKYLTKENIEGFVNFCYLLAILSVIFFFGYFFFLIPLPRQFSTLSLGEKIVALRTGLPNSFFLLFPFYFALSTLVFRSGRFPRKRDILIIVLIAVAGLLSTFRMYSFILLFGLLEAWMISSVHIRKKILWIVTTGLILFILVQVLMYFEKGSFLNVVLERVSGTNNELHSEQSSGGGRIIRNLAALPYFFDISLLLLGSMFTSQANVFSQFITGDLGILATYLLYGVFGIWLIVIIFKRGLPASWNARSVGGYDGKIAMMFFLFLIAIGPSVIFMYDPLGSENWIATWSIFLGTFDALRAHSGSITLW